MTGVGGFAGASPCWVAWAVRAVAVWAVACAPGCGGDTGGLSSGGAAVTLVYTGNVDGEIEPCG